MTITTREEYLAAVKIVSDTAIRRAIFYYSSPLDYSYWPEDEFTKIMRPLNEALAAYEEANGIVYPYP
jgi:hypothetical protein